MNNKTKEAVNKIRNKIDKLNKTFMKHNLLFKIYIEKNLASEMLR